VAEQSGIQKSGRLVGNPKKVAERSSIQKVYSALEQNFSKFEQFFNLNIAFPD